MADQICIRFGALDRRLAAAVRYALETAVTYTALVPMNALHLRMTLIAEILDSESPPEPPSHRWSEFMAECFGQNSVGLRNSTVRPSDSRSNSAALVHIDFAESYVTNETEDRVIHDLFVAAGTFLVAESTAMDEQIEQWNIAGQDGFLSEELCSIAGQAGAVGFDLLEHAEAGMWRDLLPTTTCEPDTVLTNPEQLHPPSAPAAALSRANLSRVEGSFDTENQDYVVLMVDSVEARHRQALTARALSELRGAANSYSESNRKGSVVVVSAADGRQSPPLPLMSQRLDKSREVDSSSERSIEHTLDQVVKLVEVLSQPGGGVSTTAASITRPYGEKRDLITGIRSVVRTYCPVLLIILSSEYNSISPLDLRSEPDSGSSPKEFVETLRNYGLLPDLHRVSVVFVWPALSLETHPGTYWLEICMAVCTAAGALSCEFHFSSPKRGAASPAPPTPIFRSATIRSRGLPVRAGHGSPAIGMSGVRLCDEGPVGAPVDDEDSAQPADPPKRVVSLVEPSPVGGFLSYVLADNRRTRRALIQVVSTAMLVIVVMVGIPAVRAMTDNTLFLVGPGVVMVLLCVCVLIGAGLNLRSAERQYWRCAQHVRHLNVREAEMDARGYSAAIDSSCPSEIHQRTLPGKRPPLADED